MTTFITAGHLITPEQWIDAPVIVVDAGTITEVRARNEIELPAGARSLDFPDGILAPGFIDIHIHGGAGHDVMEAGADVLPPVERLLASHGVSSYFPTTVTAPVDATLSALARLADAIEAAPQPGPRARPLGIHREGPFISHTRRGVHTPENLLAPSLD